MPNKTPQGTIDKFHALAAEGLSTRAIAKRLGVSHSTVARYVVANRTYLGDTEIREILRLRRGGMKLKHIAGQFNISIAWVSMLCRRYDAYPRGMHGSEP